MHCSRDGHSPGATRSLKRGVALLEPDHGNSADIPKILALAPDIVFTFSDLQAEIVSCVSAASKGCCGS